MAKKTTESNSVERDQNVMPKTKKRTNVKNLSKTKQELTPGQARRVKGGVAHPSDKCGIGRRLGESCQHQ